MKSLNKVISSKQTKYTILGFVSYVIRLPLCHSIYLFSKIQNFGAWAAELTIVLPAIITFKTQTDSEK